MKLDSKYFDSIRPKKRDKKEAPGSLGGPCGIAGCKEKGDYPASGRGKARLYLCLKHIREYNSEYNYFSSSDSESEAQAERQARTTGERPTWKLGARHAKQRSAPRFDDPLSILRMRQGLDQSSKSKTQRKKATGLSLKSLETLNLPEDADPETIKQRFKTLAKRYHPDLNGGDRSGEDQLKDYIQAYTMLKKNGFC